MDQDSLNEAFVVANAEHLNSSERGTDALRQLSDFIEANKFLLGLDQKNKKAFLALMKTWLVDLPSAADLIYDAAHLETPK